MWIERLRFSVPGEPRGKGRPRFSRAMGRAYTDAETRHYEDRICIFARSAFEGKPIARDVEVRLRILATFTRPANRYRKRDPDRGGKTSRCDLDNVIKAVADGINGAAVWGDDSQVVEISARKEWAAIIDRKDKTCEAPGLSVILEVWQ